MTNEPAYDEQLRLLREQVRRVRELGHDEPSSEVPLPGNVNSVDRFQRAAYFSALLPEPADDRQAIAGILAVTRNASVPFGVPYREGRPDVQHRVPHRQRPHRQAVLLRTGHQPEPPVGRDRQLRPLARRPRHDAAPRGTRTRRGRLGPLHTIAGAVLRRAVHGCPWRGLVRPRSGTPGRPETRPHGPPPGPGPRRGHARAPPWAGRPPAALTGAGCTSWSSRSPDGR
ncbi:linear amide C-N hydrolase [Streptomyces sp. NPDC090046]|uniref:linear amide C-N hydrolase n=1 Tax=Streptomyces sp. NPDC090046 TaxID=3365928 RepID=UPI00382F519B